MTSALAGLAAGRRDAATPGDATLPRGGRPSLLYDPRAAADIGLDTLHEVGVSGERGRKEMEAAVETQARRRPTGRGRGREGRPPMRVPVSSRL